MMTSHHFEPFRVLPRTSDIKASYEYYGGQDIRRKVCDLSSGNFGQSLSNSLNKHTKLYIILLYDLHEF